MNSSPANTKQANKDYKIYVGKSTTVHNLLFCAHTLCMNYVTKTFLLVSSSVRSKQLLCFVHGQGHGQSEQKHTTKNFVGYHDHSPLLTIPRRNIGPRLEFFVILTTEQVNTSPCHWTKRQIVNTVVSENRRASENELPKGFMSVTLIFESSISVVK